MSQKMSMTAGNPYGLEKRDRAILGFARVRDAAFDAIYAVWMKRRADGMTQKEIAERLGRDQAWVSRALAGPSNWTLRTLGEMAESLDAFVTIQAVPKEDVKAGNFNIYAAQDVERQTDRSGSHNPNSIKNSDAEYRQAVSKKNFKLGLNRYAKN